MTSADRASLVRLLEQAGAALAARPATASSSLLLDLAQARGRIMRHPIPWAITIHVGHIDHRHGTNVYAAFDRAALMSQLAGYCRLGWSQIEDARDADRLDDETVVRTYFAAEQEDYLTVDTIDLPGPGLDVGSLEVELTLVLSTAHITPSTSLLLDEWAGLETGKQPIGVADTGFGWFMPSLQFEGDQISPIPSDLAEVITFAQGKGCHFLLFDRDGPEVEGLDRHEW